MASNTYGKYYENDSFIISNCDLEEDNVLPKEALENPALKMTVFECDIQTIYEGVRSNSLKDLLDTADHGEFNHPEFENNYLQAMNGDLEGWKMSSLNISNDALTKFLFVTNHAPVISAKGYRLNSGVLHCIVRGKLSLRFTLNYEDGLPPIVHEVRIVNEDGNRATVTITKMLGKRKLKKIQMHEDNFGMPTEIGMYCLITEY